METTTKTRADRLLGRMHKVFSHDLPNQMLAIQSLLQMLEMDGVEGLSVEGREHVSRLHSVTRKAQGMVRFLREVGRLNGYEARSEDVRLATLIREVKVELQQHFPELLVEYELAEDAGSVRGDPRLLQQALVEIARCFLHRAPAERCVIRLASAQVAEGVQLTGSVSCRPCGKKAPPPAERHERGGLEGRLELILAQELLAAAGGSLTLVQETAEKYAFSVLVPQPAAAHV